MDLILKTVDGTTVNVLEKFNNKPILAVFYHTSCLGCTGRALPLAYDLSKEFSFVHLVVIHVGFRHLKVTKEEIYQVFTDGQPPFKIYIDEEAINYERYQAEGTPHWLIFDKNKELKYSVFGSQANASNRLYYALEEMRQTN